MSGLPSITVILIDALVTLLLVGGAFFYGQRVGEDHVSAQSAHEQQIAQAAYESAQRAAADVISKSEAKNASVQQQLLQLIQSNPVFRDCRSGADSLRDFNSAIPGWTDPAANRKLPAPNTPH